MLEHLNIQSIAKWFEKGCASLDVELVTHKNDNEAGFYILECNDICLLSKLADVKSHTLLERAHKQLKQIKDAGPRKDFLLTICNEFLRDGRRAVSLKMLTDEIDGQTELFSEFRSDMLFHRAFCLLKHEQITEALSDLYLAFENGQIQSLDKIHVQILEEIKKHLTSQESKFKEGFIVTQDKGQVSFEQVLRQYETEICQFIGQQMEKEKKSKEHQQDNAQTMPPQPEAEPAEPKPDEQCNHMWARCVRPSFYGKTIELGPCPNVSQCETFEFEPELLSGPTYKSMLMGESDKTTELAQSSSITANDSRSKTSDNQAAPNNDQVVEATERGQQFGENSRQRTPKTNEREIIFKELALTYSVDEQKMISVRQILSEQLIDNIFNLRAILVDKLAVEAKINTVCEIFKTFGTIVNIKYKDNSEKLIIEYDNSDSPRLAISYLSQVRLPHVSEADRYLEFRFYKSENQRNLRICKQNQIKTSRECYFWRTTGCQNAHCKFYHNKLAKGVDYQEWMKIEQLRGFKSKDNVAIHASSPGIVIGRGGRAHY